MSEPLARSKGHIAFIDDWEYFVGADGDVYRCYLPHLAPIMTDGRRCGRWECSREHFEQHRGLYEPQEQEATS